MGKIKTPFWKDAAAHYAGRIARWRPLDQTDVRDGDAALPVDAAYAGPLTGPNQQAVQLADLDGDGEMEIVLKWDPTNAKDNSQSGFTGTVFLDAYKLDGRRMWRYRQKGTGRFRTTFGIPAGRVVLKTAATLRDATARAAKEALQ